MPIPLNRSPEEHVVCVWDTLVQRAQAKHIGIVAHSYGGVATMALLRARTDDVYARVPAIAFTDAVHSVSVRDPQKVRDIIRDRSINWVSSSVRRSSFVSFHDCLCGCGGRGLWLVPCVYHMHFSDAVFV